MKILPVATISSFRATQAEFRAIESAKDITGGDADILRATYAVAAISAWHQGLISCVAYADALEEIANELRGAMAEARRAA